MNILIVFSDQQHKYALGKVNDDYITPNLDALCDDGVLFSNAYSSNPVCGPFRGCLMTGQSTSHCLVSNNNDPLPMFKDSLAKMMKRAGYVTSYVGKYHLGGAGNLKIPKKYRKGFDYFKGYQCYNGFDPNPPFNNEVVFWDENSNKHIYNEHRTDVTTNLAIESLDKIANNDKPFFMMVSYQAPHYPEQPSKRFADLYKDKVFKLRPDYKEVDPYTPTYSPYSARPFKNCPDFQNYGNDMLKYKRLYAGLCTQVDNGVGKIVNELKKLHKYDDTMIVYMSDHGDMQGSRGLKNKCYPYEHSAGIPMIVKYPNGRKSTVSNELISNLDIFPTIMNVANSRTKNKLDGFDITDYLTNKSDKTHDYVISEYFSKDYSWRMIRNKQYKLITTKDYEPLELYDMLNDEYEMNNIVDSETYINMILEMIEILKSKTGKMKHKKI